MKTCNDCQAELVVGVNWPPSRMKNSSYYCNACRNVRNKKYVDKEKKATYMKQYYADNREHILEHGKQWREDNSNYMPEYMKGYFLENRADFVRRRAERRAREADAICLEHHECKRIQRLYVWYRSGTLCQVQIACNGKFVPFDEFEADHIIPIIHGGLHCYLNLQVSCQPCNRRKGSSLELARRSG